MMNEPGRTSLSQGMQPIRRITQGDIAKALKVSKSTVSLALRNHPRITVATRRRVHEKAEEMGYRPDPMLNALRNYRSANQPRGTTEALAWINFYRRPEALREKSFFNRYWEGAYHTAAHLGFQLEEFRWKELPFHRMHSIFKARGIRGIVLPPALHTEAPTPAELATFPWEQYAIIRFGESLPSLKVNVVSSAQVNNTILAVKQMQEKGYQRIGFVGINHRKRLFSAGYLWAQQTSTPLSRQLAPLLIRMEDTAKLPSLLEPWIKQQKPDAILCGIDQVYDALQHIGYDIPGDIAIASVSQSDSTINAGIDQKPEQIGRKAIHALNATLNENNVGIPSTQAEILINGKWVDGSMLPRRK